MSTAASPTSGLGSEVSTVFVPRGPIGFEFSVKTEDSLIVVSQVRQGGTAERAGLKCGSILKAVNKQPIDGLTFLQVSNMIRRTSGLLAEISVVEPQKLRDENSMDDLLTLEPTRFNATPKPDKVTSQNRATATSANIECASVVQNEPTPDPPPSPNLLPVYYSPPPLQFLETSTVSHKKAIAQLPPYRTRSPNPNTSSKNGLVCSRELRRQAVLFPNDAVCVKEQPSERAKFTKYNFFSSRQPRPQPHFSECPESVNDALRQTGNSFCGIVDTSDTTGRATRHGALSPLSSDNVIPSLVRRHAYSSPSICRRGATVEEMGPRFLPAHPPATPAPFSTQDNALPLTCLPKHTGSYKTSITSGRLRAFTPAFVDSTKNRKHLSDEVRNQRQRYSTTSDKLGNSISSLGKSVLPVSSNEPSENTNEYTHEQQTNDDVVQHRCSKSDEVKTSAMHLPLDSDCDEVFSLSVDRDFSPSDYQKIRRNSCFAVLPNMENLQTVETNYRDQSWSKGFKSYERCLDVCEDSKFFSCSQSTHSNQKHHDGKPKMLYSPYEVHETRKSLPDPGTRRRLATDVNVVGGKQTLEKSKVRMSKLFVIIYFFKWLSNFIHCASLIWYRLGSTK